MAPRGPSRAPKYRKPTFAKTLKNHLFFKVLGGPRPSKTASKDPKSLPRGYLGLLEAISEASWDQERFRNPRPDLPVPRFRHLGPFWSPFWGPKLAQN